jgi:hypothetical protein
MKTTIDMAREAGFDVVVQINAVDGSIAHLTAFAALVRADEREACAKKAETLGVHPALNVFAGGPDWYKHGKEIAAAIRNRGNT